MTTVFAPDINGGMAAVQLIDEQQVTRPSGELEIRTSASTRQQGRWIPSEQRLKVSTQDEEGRPVSEWEQIFRPNSRGKLALSEQVVGQYRRSADGSEEWTVDTELAPHGDGKLELNRRVTTRKRVMADGGEEMVQEVMALRPGQRAEGLTLTERTITNSRPVSEGENEVTIEFQARSANGGMKKVSQSSAVVPNQPDETKPKEAEKPPGN